LTQLRDWRNDPEIRTRTREFRLLSLENQERWYKGLHDDRNTIMFAVTEEGGKLIGVVGLTYNDWKNRRAEVSIYIGDLGAQGKGYGFDALRTLMRYGFHHANLHKLYAEIFAFNEPSVRLFEKAGFRREGTKREDQFVDGKYWDTHVYSILAPEFEG
jgi:RimJ/RimL family protein N-acetyltransferase